MEKKDIKERDEVHKAIWAIADDLRGAVDGWDFKQYVLGIMFYRYISENITNYINEGEKKAGNTNFDYAKITDEEAETIRKEMVEEKGFFILPSELFENVYKKAKENEILNETLEKVFNNIENSAKGTESEKNLKGLFDDIDVNSKKLGTTVEKRNDKLVKVLEGIANIPLGNYKDNKIDAFGDAYEFLMSMYASNAGKSGGEFYTPQEVSELLTRLAILGKKTVEKVYDPACGSGSLLLKSAKILGKENVKQGFYGQEINLTTYNLCRINMFLHDIDYDKFDIECEDTLITPKHLDKKPFDVIVSNPPYSIKWVGNDNALLMGDQRYSPAGVLAPKSKADFAFIMHALDHLAQNGTAAIVCFPGTLYRCGAEQQIREYLIKNNFIDCIIQLPGNLFYGTSIATCIMVLKKNKKENSTLFIDATNECVRVSTNNKLKDENIENILKTYIERKDIEHISRLVTNEEIKTKEYNLAVSTYVKKEDTRIPIDIKELNKEINSINLAEDTLQKEINEKIAGNKMEELINQINPEDVKLVKLKNICNISIGEFVHKDKQSDDAPFPVYNGGTTNTGYYENYNNEGQKVLISARGANAGFVNKIEGQYWAGNSCYSIEVIDKQEIDWIYIYYYLKNNENKLLGEQQTGSIPAISKKQIEEFEIAIPPIKIQRQIIYILDKFTGLLSEMEKELEARKKQYEYYRDELLTFKEQKNK